jgi:hypothetical protein
MRLEYQRRIAAVEGDDLKAALKKKQREEQEQREADNRKRDEEFKRLLADSKEKLEKAQRDLEETKKQQKTTQTIIEQLKAVMPVIERLADFLAQTPFSIEQRRDRLIISLGLGDNEPIRFFSPYKGQPEGIREPILEHAKASKVEMLKDATTESVIADFLKKHQAKK